MKFIKTWFVVTTILLFTVLLMIPSCTKQSSSSSIQYADGWTRVVGVKGTDTSSTRSMNTRVETVGLVVAEDDKLLAKLIAYNPLPNGKGQYVIEMTNKQNYQVMLNWGWEGLTIDNASNTLLNANEVLIITLIGDAKPGKIKVQAQKIDGGSNSSTLIVQITTVILPIDFTSSKAYRSGDQIYVTWSTETPQDVDWFFIMWSPDGSKEKEVIKGMLAPDASIKSYSFKFSAPKIGK